MRAHTIKLLVVLLSIILLLSVVTACDNNSNNLPDDCETTESSTEKESVAQTTDITSESKTTSPVIEDKPILADINHDGTEDKIFITCDNTQNDTVIIQICNGKDDTELYSDSLSLNSNKKGAYCLKIGKNNNLDQLVHWHYQYLPNDKLVLEYSVFSFEGNEIKESDANSYIFNLGNNATFASQNIVLSQMVAELHEHILSSFSYNVKLLVDNRGEKLLMSSADNMLESQELTYTIESFINPTNEENTTDSDDESTETSSSTVVEDTLTVGEPILADLNNDGTDDKIVILFNNEDKTHSTIKVVNGTDSAELMQATLSLNADEIGAYYLQTAKEGTIEKDRLVYWSYKYISDTEWTISYSIWSFNEKGETEYAGRNGRKFNVSDNMYIDSQQQTFQVYLKELNQILRHDNGTHNTYLLLDNQKGYLIYSTDCDILVPEELIFDLRDFKITATN